MLSKKFLAPLFFHLTSNFGFQTNLRASSSHNLLPGNGRRPWPILAIGTARAATTNYFYFISACHSCDKLPKKRVALSMWLMVTGLHSKMVIR